MQHLGEAAAFTHRLIGIQCDHLCRRDAFSAATAEVHEHHILFLGMDSTGFLGDFDSSPQLGGYLGHQHLHQAVRREQPDRSRLWRGRRRQFKVKLAAMLIRFLDPQMPLHRIAKPFAQGETHTSPTVLPRAAHVGLVEHLKQPRTLLLADTDARVAHDKAQLATRLGLQAHLHAALMRELDRIANDMPQHLLHQRGIEHHAGRTARIHSKVKAQPFDRCITCEARAQLVQQRIEHHGLAMHRQRRAIHAGVVKNVRNHAQQRVRSLLHGLHRLLLPAASRGGQHLGVADDHVQRRAQLMAHAR